MPKPSRISCEQYKACIYRRICEVLGRKEPFVQLEACKTFDQLTGDEKQLVMQNLARDLKLSVQEVTQHYRNCFSRVLYLEDFTKYHEAVVQQVAALYAQNRSKKEIVNLIKDQYKDKNIFPPSIESFIYQTLSKLDRNQPTGKKRQFTQRKKRYPGASESREYESRTYDCKSDAKIIDDVLELLAQADKY